MSFVFYGCCHSCYFLIVCKEFTTDLFLAVVEILCFHKHTRTAKNHRNKNNLIAVSLSNCSYYSDSVIVNASIQLLLGFHASDATEDTLH